MPSFAVEERASRALETLCGVSPNRRTGSAGNRWATGWLGRELRSAGWEVDDASFACLDYDATKPSLTCGSRSYPVYTSPYSLGCECERELVAASTIAELTSIDFRGKLLLLHGELCAEPLTPKNYPFYGSEDHKILLGILERGRPAAIIAATGQNPALAGAQSPFPLIVDGDFDIPSVYSSEEVGAQLLEVRGQILRLTLAAERIAATAQNVVASVNALAQHKVVITAHVDAYEDSPGALDNASGTVVLWLLAEMLADHRGDHALELAFLNGEDHYSAAGQLDYLSRYGAEFERIKLAVNVDGVGYQDGLTAFSFYEVADPLQERLASKLAKQEWLIHGEPWFSGDHILFMQKEVPAIAFTSESLTEMTSSLTHTARDTLDKVDCGKLVKLASFLAQFVRYQ